MLFGAGDNFYQYKLGGLFYDEEQKLTIGLVATSKGGGGGETKKSAKRVGDQKDKGGR